MVDEGGKNCDTLNELRVFVVFLAISTDLDNYRMVLLLSASVQRYLQVDFFALSVSDDSSSSVRKFNGEYNRKIELF